MLRTESKSRITLEVTGPPPLRRSRFVQVWVRVDRLVMHGPPPSYWRKDTGTRGPMEATRRATQRACEEHTEKARRQARGPRQLTPSQTSCASDGLSERDHRARCDGGRSIGCGAGPAAVHSDSKGLRRALARKAHARCASVKTQSRRQRERKHDGLRHNVKMTGPPTLAAKPPSVVVGPCRLTS
jgi:hypothetical protein